MMVRRTKPRFNTQPPEGGWLELIEFLMSFVQVSTHSRPKAAGRLSAQNYARELVSTHSRPKAAGFEKLVSSLYPLLVSTHSRPKAAGAADDAKVIINIVSTHSRPKAAGLSGLEIRPDYSCFNTQPPEGGWSDFADSLRPSSVSTHSRPKAAGSILNFLYF